MNRNGNAALLLVITVNALLLLTGKWTDHYVQKQELATENKKSEQESRALQLSGLETTNALLKSGLIMEDRGQYSLLSLNPLVQPAGKNFTYSSAKHTFLSKETKSHQLPSGNADAATKETSTGPSQNRFIIFHPSKQMIQTIELKKSKSGLETEVLSNIEIQQGSDTKTYSMKTLLKAAPTTPETFNPEKLLPKNGLSEGFPIIQTTSNESLSPQRKPASIGTSDSQESKNKLQKEFRDTFIKMSGREPTTEEMDLMLNTMQELQRQEQ